MARRAGTVQATSATNPSATMTATKVTGSLLGTRYLIHDRDPLFTEAVRGLLRDVGGPTSPTNSIQAVRFLANHR